MPSFAKLFRSRNHVSKKNAQAVTNGATTPSKPQWSDAWIRTRVDPEEVVELLSGCTRELKSRALDMPFPLLPFRPTSDPSAARTFIRNYFFPPAERQILHGEDLIRELRLTEPMVLSSVMKWCWSRLPGGVVTWEAYELFKIGEKDSQLARDAFATFIPISVESDARRQIIFDFFDLMAAIAAHGKTNGLGGRKLSRYAGWWAFEHFDTGKGFDAGYRGWASAADATSHLFFAYLRSLSPDPVRGTKGIIGLPISLQQLVQATEYPPEAPTLMFHEATKVVMVVDVVSPTPFALLRRAKNFEYRDDDKALQQFADHDDPVRALTDECRRVLKCISSTNQSAVSTSKASTSLRDASWSRFEDVGFGATIEESDMDDDGDGSALGPVRHSRGLRGQATSVDGGNGRPTTPSWADFLSSGFTDEKGNRAPSSILLPPDKFLPPIQSTPRGQSSQSHKRHLESEPALEPGELASIDKLDLDDSFWWVWISSLAGEEPTSRKAVFGRCALIETVLVGGRWMIMEEQVKGAAPEPAPGAYIAEKKGFFGFTTRRGRLARRKSTLKKPVLPNEPYASADHYGAASRTNIAPDQQARIQAAALKLQQRNQEQEHRADHARRGRQEEASIKTNSMMTLQPAVVSEASQAMKWASQYDKTEIRAKYLGDGLTGRGGGSDQLPAFPLPHAPVSQSAVSLPKPAEERKLSPPPERIPLPTSPGILSPRQIALADIPLPPSPNESPLPKTPSHLAVDKELPPTLPPSPPPSDKAAAPLPPDLPKVLMETRKVTTSDVPVTALPQPPSPVSDRRQSADGPSAIPRKSAGSSGEYRRQEHAKLTKKPKGGTGIKAIFGNRRPKEPAAPPPPTSPTEPPPAVAAARAALTGKNRPHMNGLSAHQITTQPATAKTAPTPSRTQQPAAPPPEPIYQKPEIPSSVSKTVPPTEAVHADGAPKIRQNSDYENLSRVDTNEQRHADHEFSTFDQGPLLEQPAHGPPDLPSPLKEEDRLLDEKPYKDHVPAEEPIREVHPAFAKEVQAEASRDEATDLSREISPVQDRWAQIRKNAAERAAELAARQTEEEQSRPSEVKTDDGETNGEETIESRVARIKARVAELTGNIDAGRR